MQPRIKPAGVTGAAGRIVPGSGAMSKKPESGKPGPVVLVVNSTSAVDDIGIEDLVGEYTEAGNNHGRKYFKRTKIPTGIEAQPVCLYFWDARDGVDQSGWWFGQSVGGEKVWSRNEKGETLPPVSGWRIPWDGDVQPDLIVEPKVKPGDKDEAKEKNERGEEDTLGTIAEAEDRVLGATDRVVIAEVEASKALDDVRMMLEGDVTEENLEVVAELLNAQANVLQDAAKALNADIVDARKTAPKAVKKLETLLPRIRTVQGSVAQVIKESDALAKKKDRERLAAESRRKEEERRNIKEQLDAKAIEEALPDAMEVVTHAEEMLEAVVTAAAPVMADGIEEMTEITAAAIRETESLVVKAQTTRKEALSHVKKQQEKAKNFAPEARKVALTEFGALQDKLVEIQKTLDPYMRIKKEFEMRIESRKVMLEVARRIADAEIEVEKVNASVAGAKSSEDELKAAESTVPPAMVTLSDAMEFIKSHMSTAHGSFQDELQIMTDRGLGARKKLQDLTMQLRSKTESLQVQAILCDGEELVKVVEGALLKMTKAEAPFSVGINAITPEEASEAIVNSKVAANDARSAVDEASEFLQKKITVVGCFPHASRGSSVEALTDLLNRVEVVSKKLEAFNKETGSRETANLLYEVNKKVTNAEAAVKRMLEVAGPLKASIDAGDDADKIKVSTQLTIAAEVEASTIIAETQKMLMTKVKEDKSKEALGLSAELGKLRQRTTQAYNESQKCHKLVITGEKMYKCKNVVQEKGEDLERLEKEVEEAEILTTPLGDERPSNEHIGNMIATVENVQKKLTVITAALQGVQGIVIGQTKIVLEALMQKVKVAQGKVDEMKETTKEQRERVECDNIIQVARARMQSVDEAFTRVDDAEVPYLKGIELLPLDEAQPAVAESEAAVADVQKAINELRAYLSENFTAVKSYAPIVSKVGLQELEALGERREAAVEKLTTFKKQTESRKRLMMQQLGVAKVEEAGEAVKKATNIADSFTLKSSDAGDETVSREVAHGMLQKFTAVIKSAEEALEVARSFLQERQRETRGAKKDKDEMQESSKMVTRLNSAQHELTKAKNVRDEHEQKFIAMNVLVEANEMKSKVGESIDAVKEEASSILADGGRRFVISNLVSHLVEAMVAQMEEAGIGKEDLWKKASVSAKEGHVDEAAFVKFLDGATEICERLGYNTSPEQKKMIFSQVDSNGDGAVTKDDFMNLFRERYVCVSPISLTDGFEISSSKTLDKIEVDDIVETLGEPKTHETQGMTRVEVRVERTSARGWVTLQSNQSKFFFTPCTPWTVFSKALDKSLTAASTQLTKTTQYIESKAQVMASCSKGPLFECKSALTKLRPQVSVLAGKLQSLRKQIEDARKDHSRREELEKKKIEDRRDRKAATGILKVISAKVEATEACLKKVEEIAAPLTAGDITTVADPIPIKEAVVKEATSMETTVNEAKACLAAHEAKVAKATKGPWFDAKLEMKKLNGRVTICTRKVNEKRSAVQQAIETLTEAKLGLVAGALRSDLHKKQSTTEALFASLADKQERISEAVFFKHLDSVPGLTISKQHRPLLFLGQNAGGFSRRAFFEMVERFYKCVKEIAITEEFDIKSSNNVRKLEVGEHVEVIEGPRSDKGLGVMRVRARALSDNKTGWITATGNHGTPYLQEVQRPCLRATKELSLNPGFASEGAKEDRKVQVHEVLEILEGPRQETVGTVMRAKGKAVSDGAVGWFTMQGPSGVDNVEPGNKSFTCLSSIALTDVEDVKNCKVLRKCSKGEKFVVLEGPVDDQGTKRIRAKAAQDGLEGWVTVRGNAGTVYLEETGTQLIVRTAIPLTSSFSSNAGSTVRTLVEKEVIEVLQSPKEEVSKAPYRVRVRAVSDGKIGWITTHRINSLPWSPRYKCVAATRMHEAMVGTEQNEGRRIEAGEEVELLQGPLLDTNLNVLRFRCRAAQDGAAGWVTIAGNQGKVFMENKLQG